MNNLESQVPAPSKIETVLSVKRFSSIGARRPGI